MTLSAFDRGVNAIGNILGTTGTNTTYESCSGDTVVYAMGCGNGSVPSDANVLATAMLWGNVDSSHGFTSPQFNSAEVPSGLTGTQTAFLNSVPGSDTLPASFFYTAKPSWWPPSKPWPIIGPDVTSGNVSGVNGLVYTNPAEDCYLALGGNSSGTGAALSFNASSCYAYIAASTSGGVKHSGGVVLY